MTAGRDIRFAMAVQKMFTEIHRPSKLFLAMFALVEALAVGNSHGGWDVGLSVASFAQFVADCWGGDHED